MGSKGMNRRQFLETSGRTVAGAVAVAGATTLLAPDGAWAMSLNALDKHTAMTLVTVCRDMYPHDTLGDAYYALGRLYRPVIWDRQKEHADGEHATMRAPVAANGWPIATGSGAKRPWGRSIERGAPAIAATILSAVIILRVRA